MTEPDGAERAGKSMEAIGCLLMGGLALVVLAVMLAAVIVSLF